MTTRADQWETNPEQFWLRGRCPQKMVEFDEETRMWHIYGYRESVEALSNPNIFSNDVGRLFPVSYDPSLDAGDFVQMDPPEHRKIRGLVHYAFKPKIVADLEPRISEITHELLDELQGKDRFDFVGEFAFPLTIIVIAEMLGVPTSHRHLFKQWMETILDGAGNLFPIDSEEEQQRDLEKGLAQLQVMRDYWCERAVERRSQPRHDLLTQLIRTEVDGERLNDIEVSNIANRLLIAGHHTTTMLLANTMLCLDTFPEQAVQVREDRSLVPTLIEESLRFLSPIAGVLRATTAEVEIAGRPIPKDQAVNVWCGAANRDERQFANPHVFDSRRAPNAHIGFGHGVHSCLGQRLARIEGRTALNIVLDRLPKLRTDPDNPPRFFEVADATGLAKMPVLVG